MDTTLSLKRCPENHNIDNTEAPFYQLKVLFYLVALNEIKRNVLCMKKCWAATVLLTWYLNQCIGDDGVKQKEACLLYMKKLLVGQR